MIDFSTWDSRTTTASDYSIKIYIPEEAWKVVQMSENKDSNQHYSDLLKEQIEKQVKELDKALPNGENEKIEIANISFGFANRAILKKLMKRGTALKAANFNFTSIIQGEIQDIIKYDFESGNSFERPTVAFVTFTNQEAMERCKLNWISEKDFFGWMQFSPEKQLQINGVKLHVEEAPEPTDVIWENL